MSAPRVTVVGEGMLQLASGDGVGWALGHGGDALNIVIHMARAGCNVAFASALGSDAISRRLAAALEREGIDQSLVLTDPNRTVGLYAITLDKSGERSFTYWRSDSAARQIFALPDSDAMFQAAARSDLLIFSLISLAILPPEGRATLLDLARQVRANGGMVAFDGNYRPRLWPSATEATRLRDKAVALADIGLPTLEDEVALSGMRDADHVAAHWQSLGCTETVVKLGGAGCRLPDGTIVAPEVWRSPVDTSGAGDAFNAAYLAARLQGDCLRIAAQMGHRLAGWTIMRNGAIPDCDAEAPYG